MLQVPTNLYDFGGLFFHSFSDELVIPDKLTRQENTNQKGKTVSRCIYPLKNVVTSII